LAAATKLVLRGGLPPYGRLRLAMLRNRKMDGFENFE
jgi:hypothetical protein